MGTQGDRFVGKTLASYRVEKLIGKGGMGNVYLAEHINLERKVALKVLADWLSGDAEFAERFIRESKITVKIPNRNVIPIYDAGEADGVLYIAMQYIDGVDFKTLIQDEGGIDPLRAIAIFDRVGGALDAAHAMGVVHRDVKPANIMIDYSGEVYLTDFGIAKEGGSAGLTRTNMFLGAYDYAAPEQFEDVASVDFRTDIYALGCTLFEALTGHTPFKGGSDASVMRAHLEQEPPRVSAERSDVPEGLDNVIAKAMAKDKEQRYQSCRDMVNDMREALGIPSTGATRREQILISRDRPKGRKQAAGGKRQTTGSDATRVNEAPTVVAGSGQAQQSDAAVAADGGQVTMPAETAAQAATHPPQPGTATPSAPGVIPASRRPPVAVLAFLGVTALVIVGAVLFAVLSGGGEGGDLRASTELSTDVTESTDSTEQATDVTREVPELDERTSPTATVPYSIAYPDGWEEHTSPGQQLATSKGETVISPMDIRDVEEEVLTGTWKATMDIDRENGELVWNQGRILDLSQPGVLSYWDHEDYRYDDHDDTEVGGYEAIRFEGEMTHRGDDARFVSFMIHVGANRWMVGPWFVGDTDLFHPELYDAMAQSVEFDEDLLKQACALNEKEIRADATQEELAEAPPLCPNPEYRAS